jgi:hypothetical protein
MSLAVFVVYVDGVRLCIWTAASNGATVHPPDDISVRIPGGMILTGEKERTQRNTCPSATVRRKSHTS